MQKRLSEVEAIVFGKPSELSRVEWRLRKRRERAVMRRYSFRQRQLIDAWEQSPEGIQLQRDAFRDLQRARARVQRRFAQAARSVTTSSRAPRRASACSGRPAARRVSRASSASCDDGPAEPPAPAVGRRCNVCKTSTVRLEDGSRCCPNPQCPGGAA